MRSSTLVLCCSALLSVTWGQTLTLVLLALPESMDLAKVVAKKFGDMEPVEMTRATEGPEGQPRCTEEEICNEKDAYQAVARLYFVGPNNLPRPLTLTMPDYTLQVSLG